MSQMNNPLFSLMGLIRNGGNPQAAIMELAKSNPQVNQVVRMMEGKSLEQLKQMAINMANERGVSINDVARQLGINLPSDK